MSEYGFFVTQGEGGWDCVPTRLAGSTLEVIEPEALRLEDPRLSATFEILHLLRSVQDAPLLKPILALVFLPGFCVATTRERPIEGEDEREHPPGAVTSRGGKTVAGLV